MKLVAVALFVVGLLCNSMLAMAGPPVPFRALMQPAGAQPGIPPMQSGDASGPAAPRRHMTTGGKVLTGIGIGLAAVGGTVIVGSHVWKGPATPADKHELYGVGGATIGIGAVMIVVGTHRRSAE